MNLRRNPLSAHGLAAALASSHVLNPQDIAPPSDGSLPEGMQSLGPIDKLGSHKQVQSRQPEAPIVWLKDEAASAAAGIDMFYPYLDLPGIANKVGSSRPFRQFLRGERTMFVQAFANDVGLFLFGQQPWTVIEHPDGIEFQPNQAFDELPTRDVK